MNLGFQVFLKASLLSDSWGGELPQGLPIPAGGPHNPAPHEVAHGTHEPLARARPLPSRPPAAPPHLLSEFLQCAGPMLASEEQR